ncbi:MAG: hypothetical protein P8Z68_09135 [Kineosporiaceae bacterium]
MRRFWYRRRPGASGEDGIALVAVVGSLVIVTLFLLAALALVLANAPKCRADQDSKAALAAADAGVADYLARLNANDTYWTLGDSDAGNPAFSAAGRVIPGTGGDGASYRYTVLSPAAEVASTGAIRLQVTGTSSPGVGHPSVSRTVTVTLSPKGFLNYVYFSDVEVVDPALMSAPLYVQRNGSTGPNWWLRYAVNPEQACGLYYYDGRAGSYTASAANPVRVWNTFGGVYTGTTYSTGTVTGTGSGGSFDCWEIQWATGDVVNGPLHSNDALQVGGSVRFADPLVESSWTNPPDPTQRWWGAGTPVAPTATPPGYWPVYGPALSMPVGNQELLKYVEPRVDDPMASPGPGCYYTGNTQFRFTGTTMQVLSPATTTAPSRCLDVANRSNWQTKAIPPVIYVDSTTNTGSYSNFQYPMTGEDTTGATTDYTRTRGTAYVQGSVSGQVTVAAEDDIVITGDLTDADGGTGTDIIGLVAGNYVWVYHPVNWWGNNLLGSAARVNNIDAAILSLRHSFLVQNWTEGAVLGTLNVTGSIAQKYRGPVLALAGVDDVGQVRARSQRRAGTGRPDRPHPGRHPGGDIR